MGNLKNNALVTNIFVLVTLFFSIEYLALGEYISVFRLIIFPLSLLGVLLSPPIYTKQNIAMYLIVSFALIANIFSSIAADNFINGLLNALGIFFFILFFTSYIQRNGFPKNMLWLFALYSLPHYIAFIIYFTNPSLLIFTSTSSRFSGIHWDPNFMSVYVNLALTAKLYLIYGVKNKTRIFLLMLIALDIVIILLGQSRAGILALFVNILLILFFNHRKYFFIFSILMFCLLYYLIERMNNLIYSPDLGLLDAILWRFNQGGNIEEDARFIHFQRFIQILKDNESIFIGYSLDNYLLKFKQYPHNLIIDIIYEQGFVYGVFFISYLIVLFIKGFIRGLKEKFNKPYLFHIAFVGFMGGLLLTSYMQKFFWLLVVLLYYSTQNMKSNSLKSVNR